MPSRGWARHLAVWILLLLSRCSILSKAVYCCRCSTWKSCRSCYSEVLLPCWTPFWQSWCPCRCSAAEPQAGSSLYRLSSATTGGRLGTCMTLHGVFSVLDGSTASTHMSFLSSHWMTVSRVPTQSPRKGCHPLQHRLLAWLKPVQPPLNQPPAADSQDEAQHGVHATQQCLDYGHNHGAKVTLAGCAFCLL